VLSPHVGLEAQEKWPHNSCGLGLV